jgi:hypothetical protein
VLDTCASNECSLKWNGVMHWFLSIDGAGGGSVECALRTQEQSSSSGEMTWMWVA